MMTLPGMPFPSASQRRVLIVYSVIGTGTSLDLSSAGVQENDVIVCCSARLNNTTLATPLGFTLLPTQSGTKQVALYNTLNDKYVVSKVSRLTAGGIPPSSITGLTSSTTDVIHCAVILRRVDTSSVLELTTPNPNFGTFIEYDGGTATDTYNSFGAYQNVSRLNPTITTAGSVCLYFATGHWSQDGRLVQGSGSGAEEQQYYRGPGNNFLSLVTRENASTGSSVSAGTFFSGGTGDVTSCISISISTEPS